MTKKYAVLYTVVGIFAASLGVAFWFFAALGVQAVLDTGSWPFFVAAIPVILIVGRVAFMIFAKWYVVLTKPMLNTYPIASASAPVMLHAENGIAKSALGRPIDL